MKKSSIVVALIAAMAIGGTAHARGGYGPGKWSGGYGGNYGCGPCAETSPEQTATYKKHLAEILPLKDEMHKKRMEIQQEWVKETPDTEKMTRLQNELREIRGKYYKVQDDAGFRKGRGYHGQHRYNDCGPGYGNKGKGFRGHGCEPCADQPVAE
ncbi:MAG: hypothetical protein RBQ99_04015 [Trichlorobacter sp.]|jgi:zinc resistance-associated protein|nr:hypothetical protein [Trichlorobacter sp.]